MGVFATRSPFRPNPIGLSSVKLIGVEFREKEGPVLIVEGADLLDMTPIYDIKPYLPYVDSHPEAKGGFAEEKKDYKLDVNFPEMYLEQIPAEKRAALIQILEQDPRPSYQKDPVRIYGMSYAGMEIHFRVDKETALCDGGRKVMKIYLAPMEGITGEVYRRAYHTFFEPMDKYFTPF